MNTATQNALETQRVLFIPDVLIQAVIPKHICFDKTQLKGFNTLWFMTMNIMNYEL